MVSNLESLAQQVKRHRGHHSSMGWWPFGKKRATRYTGSNDPMLKDTRTWLNDLRDACEMNFDAPEEARLRIRHMQVVWHDAVESGTMSATLREGLESRAFRLLTCSDEAWLAWLDDLAFWKPGWKPADSSEDED